MKITITGVAGFIGSTTATRLLQAGHHVVGIDSLSDYYDPARKRDNLASLSTESRFTFHQLNLVEDLLDVAISGSDAVTHLAGQPGVRRSWSEFDDYVANNVSATKAVLDAAVRHQVGRVVYASSSSVYGDALTYPTTEENSPAPESPYATTKLAGEQLCTLYASQRGLSTVSLRYFTVYGPRQRPDMLTQRLVEAAYNSSTVTIFGDGNQVRDFTFVDDIARANVLATTADVSSGSVFNISGGSSVSVNEMVRSVEQAAGQSIELEHHREARGDVRRTGGDCSRARAALGWEPQVDLEQGLRVQVDWYRSAASCHPAPILNGEGGRGLDSRSMSSAS